MVFHLNKVPKKVLVYFLQKNPNFKYIKNKSQEELVNIILENDILCHWDYDSYSLCPLTFLKKLCLEKAEGKSICMKQIIKEKGKMIEFLLEDNNNDILNKIKHCLEKQENLILTDCEIENYL
jgi:hypothetical protein